MTTNKPSAGAVRAAKALLHLQSPPITNDQAIRLAAEIIDRESGLAELLEAAKLAKQAIDLQLELEDHEREKLEIEAVSAINAAIAKAEKGTV